MFSPFSHGLTLSIYWPRAWINFLDLFVGYAQCSRSFAFGTTRTGLLVLLPHAMAAYKLPLRGMNLAKTIGLHKGNLLWHYDILLWEINLVWGVIKSESVSLSISVHTLEKKLPKLLMLASEISGTTTLYSISGLQLANQMQHVVVTRAHLTQTNFFDLKSE